MQLSTSRADTALAEIVQALRKQGIEFRGPFLTPKGRFVFSLHNQIVLDSELLELHARRQLTAEGVSRLLRRLAAN